MNELIFLLQVITVSATALFALRLGKEALVTFVCLSGILANVFILKQITLFGFNATCADAFAVSATLGLNILQEYFGKPIARKTIWLNFFFLLVYAAASQIHLLFIPSPADTAQAAYQQLFIFMPRIVSASFFTYLTAQTIDYLLYGFLRRIWHRHFLVIRNYASIMVSQLIDTILFSFLGLYGIVSEIWEIILVSYTIKLAVILLATPSVALASRIISKTQSPNFDKKDD